MIDIKQIGHLYYIEPNLGSHSNMFCYSWLRVEGGCKQMEVIDRDEFK